MLSSSTRRSESRSNWFAGVTTKDWPEGGSCNGLTRFLMQIATEPRDSGAEMVIFGSDNVIWEEHYMDSLK